MNKLQKTKILVLTLVFVALNIVVAFGYSTTTNGYYRNTLGINSSTYVSSAYTTPVSNAIASWNSANTGRTINVGAPYLNVMYCESVGTAYCGLYGVQTYDSSLSNNKTTKFCIVINTDMCDSQSANFKRSVVAHEFGHAFGLGDTLVSTTLMGQLRDRDTIYVPKADDISGAKRQLAPL